MRLLPRLSAAALLLALTLAQAISADVRDDWAYKPVARPKVPETPSAKHRTRNPIDAFLLAKLAEKKLAFAPEADRRTLIRRVYFDLIGLPPTPEEIEAFVADKSPDAYEKLVDQLLASPQFGERHGRVVARRRCASPSPTASTPTPSARTPGGTATTSSRSSTPTSRSTAS